MNVVLTRQVLKDLQKVPAYIERKLQLWVMSIRTVGLEETRKIPGYHDEPLRGKREGQRSIRLSQAIELFTEYLKMEKLSLCK